MNPIIQKYIESVKLGNSQVYKNMGIVPLFALTDSGPMYLTLQEALDQQWLKITEIDKGGSVPELKVTNTAAQYVLLLDGEELMGAKQNRVLNTTVLLKPNSDIVIPVSCTEQGRWAYSSDEFSSSGHVMSHSLRSSKTQSVHSSLRDGRGHYSDQGQVWDEIHKLSRKSGVNSPTGAMRDVYESKAGDLAEYEKAFEYQPQQHGALVFINGKVVGFDILSRASAYQLLHSKLVKSYAMDAMHAEQCETPSISLAADFLAATINCTAEHYPSVGYGEDHRFEAKTMVGSALVADESVIHIAFFQVGETEPNVTMAGYRQQRGFRNAR